MGLNSVLCFVVSFTDFAMHFFIVSGSFHVTCVYILVFLLFRCREVPDEIYQNFETAEGDNWWEVIVQLPLQVYVLLCTFSSQALNTLSHGIGFC